jgi:hypothetical protein
VVVRSGDGPPPAVVHRHRSDRVAVALQGAQQGTTGRRISPTGELWTNT